MQSTGDIRRFSSLRITEHALLTATFFVLAATGLSQKYHALELSSWLVMAMGGIDAVRSVHHAAGAVLIALLLEHMAGLMILVFVRHAPLHMLVTLRDFSDAVHNIRYYVGMDNSPARCGRYDYKEKFVYWGVLTGGVLMALSGLTLWFPWTVTGLLPGEAVPVAKALHTNEALLILLLLSVWHMYDSIFSPNVFPLDKSIFTGYISRKRILREHPAELAEITGRDLEEVIRELEGTQAEPPAKEASPPAG